MILSDLTHVVFPQKYDIETLQNEVLDICENAKGHEGQIMLQGIPGKDYLYGTGRITDYEEPEEMFTWKLWEDLCPTIYEILDEHKMYRSRIMIRSKSVYSWHYDYTPRIHIPIISNHETNFMVIENDVVRMPADGRAHWVDTRKNHTFVNTSDIDRIHIVGCVRA